MAGTLTPCEALLQQLIMGHTKKLEGYLSNKEIRIDSFSNVIFTLNCIIDENTFMPICSIGMSGRRQLTNCTSATTPSIQQHAKK